MEVKITKISPEQANKLLTNNPVNRNISQATVRQYVEDIRTNKWQNNGDTIRVYNHKGHKGLALEDHQLIDGQHRLTAVVKANKPIDCIIVTVDSPEVFKTIDSGKKRSASDVLSILGKKNCPALAATLALIRKMDEDGLHECALGGQSSSKVLNHEVEELLGKYPKIEDSVAYAGLRKKDFKTRPAAMAVIHYKLSAVDEDLAEEFLQAFHLGHNLTEKSPILKLREAIRKKQGSDIVISSFWFIKAFITTWNNWVSGKEISKLQMRSGPIPKIKSV